MKNSILKPDIYLTLYEINSKKEGNYNRLQREVEIMELLQKEKTHQDIERKGFETRIIETKIISHKVVKVTTTGTYSAFRTFPFNILMCFFSEGVPWFQLLFEDGYNDLLFWKLIHAAWNKCPVSICCSSCWGPSISYQSRYW